jgi:hypothetical protein
MRPPPSLHKEERILSHDRTDFAGSTAALNTQAAIIFTSKPVFAVELTTLSAALEAACVVVFCAGTVGGGESATARPCRRPHSRVFRRSLCWPLHI